MPSINDRGVVHGLVHVVLDLEPPDASNIAAWGSAGDIFGVGADGFPTAAPSPTQPIF